MACENLLVNIIKKSNMKNLLVAALFAVGGLGVFAMSNNNTGCTQASCTCTTCECGSVCTGSCDAGGGKCDSSCKE